MFRSIWRSVPRRPRRASLTLETLESRCLLASGFTEFAVPVANSIPTQITAGPDGNLWFTDSNTNAIGRITPAGVITEFPTPAGNGEPFGITAGPDGNLWFTDENANQVGRITPAGTFTEYTIPTTHSIPGAITPGPDGNLWFGEQNAMKIGRITPTGTITEFTNGISSFVNGGVTAGPDGNVWFVETSGKVARIAATGANVGSVTEFPAGVNPYQITAGPDGNLWSTETSGKIGRLTTTGNLSEIGLSPASPAQPLGIAPGPDGNLWAADFLGNDVLRITPTGAVTAIPIPTAQTQPIAITTGPDGNLWITQQNGGNGEVARLSLLGATASPVTIAVGQPIAGPVATFQDIDPGATPADFAARVTWGDGSTSAGTITVNGAGSFEVDATHTYQQVGSYAASVTVFNAHRPLQTATSSATASFTATVGAATHLAFVQQPATAFVGQPITPAVTVAVEDSNDHLLTGDSSTVTLSLASNNFGATLGGTVSAQAVNGIATFNNVSVSSPGTGLTLLAGDGNLTGAQSAPFSTPTHLVFLQQPSSQFVSQPLSPAVRVAVEDLNNQVVTTDNSSTVTLALAANVFQATLGGTLSAQVVNGIATFSSLALNRPGTGYTLLAADSGLSAQSTSFNITSVDVGVGPDNQARMLVDNLDGRARVQSINTSFQISNPQTFGPIAGYTAARLATGGDGLTRLLWTNTDGSFALWVLSASNTPLSQWSFAALPNEIPVDVAVGSDNKAHVLWDFTDGRAEVATVDNGTISNVQIFGPYQGWTATALAAGSDPVTRLMWVHTTGTISLWLLNTSNVATAAQTVGPFAGLTPTDIAVGADNKARVLLSASGTPTILTIDNSFVVSNQHAQNGSFGYLPISLAAGADGLTRLVFDHQDGASTAIWLFNADNTYKSGIGLSPFTPGSPSQSGGAAPAFSAADAAVVLSDTPPAAPSAAAPATVVVTFAPVSHVASHVVVAHPAARPVHHPAAPAHHVPVRHHSTTAHGVHRNIREHPPAPEPRVPLRKK